MKDLCNISSTSPSNQTITSSASPSSSKSLNSPKSSNSANVMNGTSTTSAVSSSSAASHTTSKNDESTNVEYMEVDNGEEPSSTQQFELSDVLQLVKRPLRLGDIWYIVDKKWYDRCLSYIEFEDNTYHPGKIDNSVLLVAVKNNAQKNYTEPMFRLKSDLNENVDYAVLPEEVWNLFLEKFGIVTGIGGNHIRCPVLDKGKSYLIVEIYPLELRLALYGSKDDMVAQYSRNSTLRTIVSDMRSLFQVNENRPVQLWNNATLLVAHSDDVISSTSLMTNNNISSSTTTTNHFATTSNIPSPPPPPPSPSSSGGQKQSNNDIDLRLLDLELAPNTVLTLELQNLDGTWPSSRTKLGAITRSKVASGVPIASPGVCGLMNLGNTCFMNAALQCLSNTPPLTNFLLADRHLEDINPDNPLGMGGEIARCYSELIKAIWSGHHVTLTPRDFKVAVGRFAPQFMGFAQHDCQELMAFLLDGLHEDLNRVKVKPYIEMNNDLELRPDEIVAAESWTNYKRRNDSIIVDTFHSQLKSTLVCPECNLVSVTFDPFCYLTLPLPYKRERSVDITFVPATSKRPLYTPQRGVSRFATSSSTVSSSTSADSSLQLTSNQVPARSILMESINIPKEGIISEICAVVAKLLNESCGADSKNVLGRKLDPKQLIVANVFGNRLSKLYSSDDPYTIHFEDIVVYEKEDSPIASGEVSTGQIQNLATKPDGYHLPVFIREFDPSSGENPISRPFFIYVKSLSYEDIQEAIFKELVGLISPSEQDSFFKSLKEENVKEEKMDVASSSTSSNKNQSFKRQVASSLQDGSDGEGSEMDDEDDSQSRQQVTHSIGDDEDAEDEDEGVETSGYYTRSSKNSFQNTPFTISVVDMHATNEFTILRAGVRIDCPTNTYLAININSRIVSKYFTRNVNSFAQAKLSSMLPSFSNPPRTLITLGECINQFTLTEKLGADDPWYCPRCKKHQMASKKFDIWLLPNILIIHMKRFSYSRIHRDKLDVLVDFPIKDLDMTPYVLHNPNNEKYTYDLIGVANHYGGLGGGHYTAYAKNMINNVWFYFDDSSVSAVSESNVVTKSAYVLYYQRHQTNNPETVPAGATDNSTTNSSVPNVNNSKLS